MIRENVRRILAEFPSHVTLVAATKARSVSEINEAIEAGITNLGENYIQEAEEKFIRIKKKVRWHLIGHLQKNKAKRATKIFDMIETLDSPELAEVLDRECNKANKIMPVLIEVNSGQESQKAGIAPDAVEGLMEEIIKLPNLKPMGLMTMGPLVDNPESIRPLFKFTKDIFDKIGKMYEGRVEWRYLSMGMSDTYRVAIEEGANIVRVGTAIFGRRDKD
ncbi:MAG: YggS family pyridoxal phosphate-dependent enzyme [Candidatus Omnitrophota bacterium]|nr:MAG: YggS family pyridoxal phosphate-dependent enzyme [Candidatus Omnitrophota bacterium]